MTAGDRRPAAGDRDRHLVLVGLPGAGKSTIGRGVAERLGRPFLDLDEEIERLEGRSVGELFRERGEAAFRRLERELTRRIATMNGMVVAPGGGWVTVPDTVALVRHRALIVHLKVTPATALDRLERGGERERRPLLRTPDPQATLEALWRARQAAYEAADLEVDTEAVDPQRLMDVVAALAAPVERG